MRVPQTSIVLAPVFVFVLRSRVDTIVALEPTVPDASSTFVVPVVVCVLVLAASHGHAAFSCFCLCLLFLGCR